MPFGVAPNEEHQAAIKREFFSYYEEHQDITMISLYGLFILLLTAEAIHAQGNKDDDDGANQASGSKDSPKQDTSLPLRADYLSLKRPLQESNILDQSGAPSSADFQLEVECTGGRWLRKISKSCSQQQSPLELRPSTLHDPPQSDEMSLPAYAGESEVESYRQGQNTDQYREFIAGENKYFKSEYLFEDILGKGDSAMVYLATKKYNGMKVAYKSILKKPVEKYAFESNPRPRCHIPSPLVGFEEQSIAQCMSSRPANLLFPHEFALQMYLSRPGRENPYVPTTFDYIALEDEYILVMEHLDEKWSTLSKYVEKKGQLDIEEARNIIKEIVKAMISLKQNGVLHGDLNADNVMYNKETNQVKLIDFGVSGKLPGWEGGKSVPLKSSDPPSTASEYKAETDELQNCWVAALDPGVENVYTWLRGGVINGEADLDQLVGWTGTVEHESMGTRHDNRALAARLADFLQVAYRTVSIHIVEIPPVITLWKLAKLTCSTHQPYA
ncbi:hypothetical protein BASA83_002078 [Batrachochytrium salamandrivorans]|nr:hypothetical protein BASA83_002078 [Batrachochytrium salamandrivorans]